MTAPARHDVVGIAELLDEARDVVGIVLEVGVERDHDRIVRVGESGGQRRGLPEVPPKPHETDAAVADGDLLQRLPRSVRRAVVDIDHLVVAPHRIERLGQTIVKRFEVVLFVEDGKDHGERHGTQPAHRRPLAGRV